MGDSDPKVVRLTAREIEILQEIRRRAPWEPLSELFPKQRAFVEDSHRFKAALCGRRAGKTTSVMYWAIDIALKQKNANILYIALTINNARELMFKPIKRVVEEKKLRAKVNETLLTITFENGSEIKCRGADRAKEIEKLRGENYSLVIIDEAASFDSFLEVMIDEVLKPALYDRLGTLVMVGTPAARFGTLFYKVTRPELNEREGGWSVHTWTMVDNPHMQHALHVVEADMKAKGWTDQTPAFLREYRAQWVKSDEEFVYKFNERKNTYVPSLKTKWGLPDNFDWHTILSVDLGFRDKTAFVVSAFAPNCSEWFVIEAFAKADLIPTDVAALMIQLRDKYQPHKMLMDCGALGLPIAEEFRQRWGLQIEAADKKEKRAAIELMNGDLSQGNVKVPVGSPLIAQWQTLQLDENDMEDPSQPNDLADAALYGYRFAKHYLPADAVKPVLSLDQETQAMWDRKAKELRGAESREWWETGEADPFSYFSED